MDMLQLNEKWITYPMSKFRKKIFMFNEVILVWFLIMYQRVPNKWSSILLLYSSQDDPHYQKFDLWEPLKLTDEF